MKKVFCILSILTIVSPAFADAVPGTPTTLDPQPTGEDKAVVLAGAPLYELVGANSATDGNAASAGYVKGAYNAAIKAVNKVADTKQDTISVTDASNGAVVTGVALAADGKTVNVTKSYQTTVPVGSNSNSTRAVMWVE